MRPPVCQLAVLVPNPTAVSSGTCLASTVLRGSRRRKWSCKQPDADAVALLVDDMRAGCHVLVVACITLWVRGLGQHGGITGRGLLVPGGGGDEYRNSGRQKGSPGRRDLKREAILAYALAHTGVSESEIAGALGVSRPTAIKWSTR